MGFKDIFIKSDESSDDKPIQKAVPMKESIQFPETKAKPVERQIPTQSVPKQTSSFNFGFGDTPAPAPTYVPTPIVNVSVTQDQIDKAYAIYEKGFDSLNMPGYDFYEFFKMVLAGGIDNAPIYAMAFAMGKSADSSITKEALVAKADYYLDEINKVYENFTSQGNAKKQEILGQKSSENQQLVSNVELIQQQIESLHIQLTDSQNKLKAIDSKYATAIGEMDAKLSANSLAKDKIVGSITTVKNGLINNVN